MVDMSSTSASLQLKEVRTRAESQLSSSGSASAVTAEIQAMATAPLPLSEKYRHVDAKAMVKENTAGDSRQQVEESMRRLIKALSILEKYGCNLTNPARPRYWRSVKNNNPVFRATVDAIKGGRGVLNLLGYTNQQFDGLSFPDGVTDPDVGIVAAVTLEVMTLRLEVDMLLKGIHPHPEFFKDITQVVIQQGQPVEDAAAVPAREDREEKVAKVAPTHVLPSPPDPTQTPNRGQGGKAPAARCSLCGGVSAVICPSCTNQPFCEPCDDLFHRHPSRATHKRDKIQKIKTESCSICDIASVHTECSTCVQRLCLNCDRLYHSHPEHKGHKRTPVTPAKTYSPILSPWECCHCTTVNEVRAVLCATCERPRLATPAPSIQEESASVPSSPNTEWQCRSCTVVNQGSSVLCEVCERPRLATRPLVTPTLSSPGSVGDTPSEWKCQICTYANPRQAVVCEICSTDSGSLSVPQSLLQSQSPTTACPKPRPRVSLNLKRENMRDDGLKLINHIREAEKRGVSPEEVYAALSVCSNVDPCDWLTSELPHLLDEICAMAASVQQNYKLEESGLQADGGVADQQRSPNGAGGVQLSRAEAKQAWLSAGGSTEKAVGQLLKDRQAKMRELQSLGFRDESQCEEALRLSGGEIKGALSVLQRPLLAPFHQRIWNDQPEAPFDPASPDKQRLCRRLLALYNLPSWGRCELALSLLQEPDISYTLEDVVQAVKESQNKDFIKRILNVECPCCLSIYPWSKMQSLTSCQCAVCHECFGKYFTIAVRDKHIRDMVCPVCSGPDINDPMQLNSYFSTLDIQLRNCLEPDVYDLYHKKLTEHALMKDPKFLWCCTCVGFGFIYVGDQLKVTCPSCCQSFCAKCKKPWEPQHQDLSCDKFQQWKRENDPECQKQGLAGYLRDNGITCPSCRFQYALTKGGCMHFTCSQCRYQFCSGCNNPFHTTACKTAQCKINGLHAHHPRDCLFYLRDWEPVRLQALLKENAVEFNTDLPNGTQTDACGVIEQKDEGGLQIDSPCGLRSEPGQAGLCEKHYKEYLVSLINKHSLDPALLYSAHDLSVVCDRSQVDRQRAEDEDDAAYHARLLKKLMEVPLGENVNQRE